MLKVFISLYLINLFFEEEIAAWKHGSGGPKLSIPFGHLQDAPMAAPSEMDFDIYTQQQKNLIYKIYSIYGEHTASYLRNLTHQHSIWLEAIGNIDHTMDQRKNTGIF